MTDCARKKALQIVSDRHFVQRFDLDGTTAFDFNNGVESIAKSLRQARADALEEAAKVAAGMWWQGHGHLATEPYAAAKQASDEIAAAIRALKEK